MVINYNGKVYITDAAISLRPNGGCSLEGDDADNLIWDADTLASDEGVPTKAEITAEQTRLQAIEDAQEYARNRKAEYPEIKDQLDMLWHAIDTGDWTAAKVKLTSFYTELKAVKDKYPKE